MSTKNTPELLLHLKIVNKAKLMLDQIDETIATLAIRSQGN